MGIVPRRGRRRHAPLLAAVALLAAACGGGDEPTDPATATGTDVPSSAQAVEGVSDQPCPSAHPETVNVDNGCLYLGILSALTEPPHAAVAEQFVAGQVAFWRTVNERGGVGGFDVDVTEYTRDTGADPAVHAEQYAAIAPNVLALAQTFGVETTQGVLDQMQADDMVAVPASGWSGWLFEELLLLSGTSTCLQTISALDYADLEWVSSEITTTTVVAYDGPDGDDAVAGAQAWAAATGRAIDVVRTGPNILVGSQAEAITRIVDRNPTVVVLAVGPAEAAEIIRETDARGHNGVFLGVGATWGPALAESEQDDLLDVVYRNVSAWGPLGTDTPAHDAIEAAAADGAVLTESYVAGWLAGYPLLTALRAVTEDGAVTRAAVRAAAASMTVDYEGALPTVDFPDGSKQLRSVVISGPDRSAPTGLKALQDGYTGPTAESFALDGACGQD